MRKTIEFIYNEYRADGKPVEIDASNVLKYFPAAKITSRQLPIAFDKHPRQLWRQHDYADFKTICESRAEVAVAYDADMVMVSDKVKALTLLVRRFGFCVAASGRYTVAEDTRIGADSDGKLDETAGTGFAICPAVMAVDPNNQRVRQVMEVAASIMLENPMRGPLALWRAIWQTGIYPYMLPQQWCVCGDHLGIGDEIILHAGDRKVRDYYGV